MTANSPFFEFLELPSTNDLFIVSLLKPLAKNRFQPLSQKVSKKDKIN